MSILSTYFHMKSYDFRKSVALDFEVLTALMAIVSHLHPPNLSATHLREISCNVFSHLILYHECDLLK